MWSEPEKPATSAPRPCSPGSLPKRNSRPNDRAGQALCFDAEPLQSGLPRGRARDDPLLHRPGHRADPVEPDGPGFLRRQPPQARRGRDDARPIGRLCRNPVLSSGRLPGRRACLGGRPRAQPDRFADRPGVAAARNPTSARPSSARPSWITSTRRSPPWRSNSPLPKSSGSRSFTSRTRCWDIREKRRPSS